MLLKNHWYVAATEDEVGAAPLARTILGEAIVLFRTGNGEPAALRDVCPHRLAPLSMGRITPRGLACGYHSLTFAPDGTCIDAPGCRRIPPRARVRSFPLVSRFGWIWIWMGEPEAADPVGIPDLITRYFQGGWAHARGYCHFRGNFQLAADNLLDPSHADTVHPGTLGSEEIKEYDVNSRIEGSDVCIDHLSRDHAPTGLFRFLLGTGANVDQWVRVRWTPPGVVVLDVGSCLHGQAPATGRRLINLNLLTPETAVSTHYFWTTSRDFDVDDDDLTEQIRVMTAAAFSQDIALIEAQQRYLGSTDLRDHHLATTSNDVAANRAREIIAGLVETAQTIRPARGNQRQITERQVRRGE